MRHTRRPAFILFVLAFGATAVIARAADVPTYERDIRPLLHKRCTICHSGKNRNKPDLSGGLALDSLEAILTGVEDHRVVASGDASKSALALRLTETDTERRMPLDEDPLSPPEIALIQRWIDAGLPRGEASAPTTADAKAKAPARRRAAPLDVTLKTGFKATAGKPGWGPGGPVDLVMKVGPLPAITALAFRGDGRVLAVGSAGSVVVWDLVAGEPIQGWSDIPGAVHTLAFSRDGRRLALGAGQPARSGVVQVYDVLDGRRIQDFQGHDDVVYSVAFRPDDAQLTSASFDQSVRVWDLIDGRPVCTFKGHSDFVYDVAFTHDGKTILSTSKDKSIKRFDAATAKGLRTYSGHQDDVLALARRPGDSDVFVTAGAEPQIIWWTLDADKPVKKVGGHGGPVFDLAFSADGSRLISASGDKSVRLWDGKSGVFQKSLPGPTEWQYAAALSGDGHLAAAGGWDGLIRVWNADNGQLLATMIQPIAHSESRPDWLLITASGYLNFADTLADRLRYRIGAAELDGEVAGRVLRDAENVRRALRGQSVKPSL